MANLENKLDNVGGKIKEGVGNVTDNEKLEAEGKADQVVADVKDALDTAGEKIKDVAETAGEKLKEVADKVVGSLKDDEK